MNIKKVVGLSIILLLLGAASCGKGSTDSATRIGQLTITTQINSDNTPVGEVATVLDRAPKIYLSAEVVNARRGDQVTVTWRQVTLDQIIATEVFTGRRSSDQPHDFIIQPSPTTSWLASTIVLGDISWPTGEYEAAVQLNDQTNKNVGFTVVMENEFDIAAKKALVKTVWLGKGITSENQIVQPSTQFDRYEDKIYAVALTQNAPKGTQVRGVWKLLETGEVLNEFVTDVSGNDYLPFALTLDEVGRSVWSKGSYTFSLYVDNVLVTTKNFTIS